MLANNSLTAAALTLGVEAEDLAKVLPALKAAKEFRFNGVTVRINPTESWEPVPRLNHGVSLVTVDLHLTTYREAPGPQFRDDTLNTLAKAFFGPK